MNTVDSGFTLSVRINKLFLVFGFLIFSFNSLFALVYNHPLHYFISHAANVVIISGLILLTAGHYLFLKALKYCHIIILSITAGLSIISDYTQFFGMGQVILLTLTMYKYDFLRTHIRIKLMLISIGYIATTEYSLINSGKSGTGVDVFVYIIYFLIFLFILYKAEFDKILTENQKVFDDQIDSIQKEKDLLINEVNGKEARIAKLNMLLETQVNGKCRMDMDKYHLTMTEKKVIHLLATRNLTNRDMAVHLKVKEGTVKSHFYNIFNKIGVSTRNELIGLYYSIDLGR